MPTCGGGGGGGATQVKIDDGMRWHKCNGCSKKVISFFRIAELAHRRGAIVVVVVWKLGGSPGTTIKFYERRL